MTTVQTNRLLRAMLITTVVCLSSQGANAQQVESNVEVTPSPDPTSSPKYVWLVAGSATDKFIIRGQESLNSIRLDVPFNRYGGPSYYDFAMEGSNGTRTSKYVANHLDYGYAFSRSWPLLVSMLLAGWALSDETKKNGWTPSVTPQILALSSAFVTFSVTAGTSFKYNHQYPVQDASRNDWGIWLPFAWLVPASTEEPK